LAGERRLVSYSDLFAPFGLGDKKHRRRWATILDHINRYTYPKYRLLISVLVYNVDTKYPGSGFIELAKNLGIVVPIDEKSFTDEQRQRVWGHDWVADP
jgi:phytoene dehydrogenase-like protein